MNPDTFGAADLRALLSRRLDGTKTDHGATLYAYGAGARDAVLPGRENTTTVLAHHPEGASWFVVEVRQFFPDRMPALWLDHDVLRSLTARAERRPVPFTVVPTEEP
ncbi:hypothetical protein [Gandjariella thermophila]|uniref:Uncharacterized protein n=1 Tax=Gandjariella thermophila TaxID=1931992 RepID=A0A4D4J4N7_9PSEU|nr:hypothetical protein [Gandjariella thermophila]GDY30070.1 hypothetical protein GTS_17030 [Gandjariella thermophila]